MMNSRRKALEDLDEITDFRDQWEQEAKASHSRQKKLPDHESPVSLHVLENMSRGRSYTDKEASTFIIQGIVEAKPKIQKTRPSRKRAAEGNPPKVGMLKKTRSFYGEVENATEESSTSCSTVKIEGNSSPLVDTPTLYSFAERDTTMVTSKPATNKVPSQKNHMSTPGNHQLPQSTAMSTHTTIDSDSHQRSGVNSSYHFSPIQITPSSSSHHSSPTSPLSGPLSCMSNSQSEDTDSDEREQRALDVIFETLDWVRYQSALLTLVLNHNSISIPPAIANLRPSSLHVPLPSAPSDPSELIIIQDPMIWHVTVNTFEGKTLSKNNLLSFCEMASLDPPTFPNDSELDALNQRIETAPNFCKTVLFSILKLYEIHKANVHGRTNGKHDKSLKRLEGDKVRFALSKTLSFKSSSVEERNTMIKTCVNSVNGAIRHIWNSRLIKVNLPELPKDLPRPHPMSDSPI